MGDKLVATVIDMGQATAVAERLVGRNVSNIQTPRGFPQRGIDPGYAGIKSAL